METKRYDETELQEAAEALKEGELVAFPTETVYGLGANALLPNAVKKVFSVKGRPQDNPLIVHVASFEQVKEYVDNFHPAAEKIVKNFWPGPLTLIFKIKKDTLPSVVTEGLSTAAFRIPDNKKTLEVIELSGVPLVGQVQIRRENQVQRLQIMYIMIYKEKLPGLLMMELRELV